MAAFLMITIDPRNRLPHDLATPRLQAHTNCVAKRMHGLTRRAPQSSLIAIVMSPCSPHFPRELLTEDASENTERNSRSKLTAQDGAVRTTAPNHPPCVAFSKDMRAVAKGNCWGAVSAVAHLLMTRRTETQEIKLAQSKHLVPKWRR